MWFKNWLAALTGAALAGMFVPALAAQAPGQSGVYNGSYRDYDSFLSRSLNDAGSDRIAAPGTGTLRGLRGLPQLAPLTALRLPSAMPYDAAGRQGRLLLPWTLGPGGKYHHAIAVDAGGKSYYWGWWPSAKGVFYCYDPAAGRYVGAYDRALAVYRPYDAALKTWGASTRAPVPLPTMPPTPPAAGTRSDRKGPLLPEPPRYPGGAAPAGRSRS